MAKLEVRLEQGYLRFYLEGQRLREGARLELLRGGVWVSGRYRSRPSSAGDLVTDSPRSRFLRLSEASELRLLRRSRRSASTAYDFGRIVRDHLGAENSGLEVRLVHGRIQFSLRGRLLREGKQLEVFHRRKWRRGYLAVSEHPTVVQLVCAGGSTPRIDALHELRFPEAMRLSSARSRSRHPRNP